ncbi:MAG: YqjF family protein, partial [Gemmatimonadaceae bacterium]
MTHPAFREVDHRPWPLPSEPWVWRQVWHDLAFLHWHVAPDAIRHLVPKELTLDEFDGQAWVAVTPFWMSDVALRGVPSLPGVSSFPEVNVRTYVRHGDRRGVWFFSLDAASHLAVWVAQHLFRLPYVYAHMRVRPLGARILYSSRRPSGPGFLANYEPVGPVRRAVPGSLEHFLTERY